MIGKLKLRILGFCWGKMRKKYRTSLIRLRKGEGMKPKLFLTVLLLAAIWTVGCPRDKQSQDAELSRVLKLPYQLQSLVGVKGVWVLIDYLDENALSTGLTEEQIKKDVESKLRLNGITANARPERAAFKDGVYLHISINTLAFSDSPDIVFGVSVELSQPVELRTGLSMSARAITWYDRCVGMYPKSEFAESTRQEVKNGVDTFIYDYFIANPKK